MRTTLDLNTQLMKQARKAATDRGTTLTAVIEDALRESLQRARTKAGAPRRRLTTFKGDGLRQGIDLRKTSELLELLDDAAP